MKTQNKDNNRWVYISELRIKVQKNLNQKIKFKDIIIPKGCRLMTLQEGIFIFDNVPEIKISEWEWIEQYSKSMKNNGYSAALYSYWDDVRLDVNGYDIDDDRYGFAFGVHFVKDVKRKKKEKGK